MNPNFHEKIISDMFLYFESRLSNSIDLFITRNNIIKSFVIPPKSLIKKKLFSEKEIVNEYNPQSDVYLLISIPKLVSVNMTSRQEIKDFEFKDGPIGLEVEIQFGRITVSKIIDGSQAAGS